MNVYAYDVEHPAVVWTRTREESLQLIAMADRVEYDHHCPRDYAYLLLSEKHVIAHPGLAHR